MSDKSLKDQLKQWKAEAPQPPPDKSKRGSQGESQGAVHAAPRAAPQTREPDEPERELSDEELFEKAVEDVGDGSVAILEKYGRGHLSGEGEPAGEGADRDRDQRSAPEADDTKQGDKNLSDTALFLDALEGVAPLKPDK